MLPAIVRNYHEQLSFVGKLAVFAALPWLTLLVLSLASGNNCLTGIPVWSDELDYWREIYSFSAARDGWFGYYGFSGAVPAVGTWGCHGIAPLVVYGPWAMLFGWQPASIVLCNAAFCSVGLLAFCVLAKPSWRQLSVISILWLMFPPVLLYAPSSMMELPQYGALFVYVGLLVRFWRTRSRGLLAFTCAWIVYLMILRVSNMVLFAPLVLIASDFRLCRKFWLYSAAALILSVCAYKGASLFCAPYPGGFLSSLGDIDGTSAKVLAVLRHTVESVRLFFAREEGWTQVSQRYAYACDFVACAMYAARGYVLRRKGGFVNDALVRTCSMCAFVLGLYWLVVVAAYDVFDWRDYRTLAPVLFGTFVAITLAVQGKIRCIVQGICVACCAVLLMCAVRVFSGSAAFEANRYESLPDIPSSIDAASLTPVGKTRLDRTMLVLGGTLPRWLVFFLPPELGLVARDGSPNGSYGYVIAQGTEFPEGYDVVWSDTSSNIVIGRKVTPNVKSKE